MYRLLLLLVALAPVTVLGATVELHRSTDADVVLDGASYTSLQVQNPHLDITNNWTDDAVHVSHAHPPGVVLEVEVFLVNSPDRFSLDPTIATIDAGETTIFQIRDSDHTPGTHQVTILLEVDFHTPEKNGSSVMERTVQVVVE